MKSNFSIDSLLEDNPKDLAPERELMIKDLIDSILTDYVAGNIDEDWMENMLRVGLKGYNDMDDEEIAEEHSRLVAIKARESKDDSPNEIADDDLDHFDNESSDDDLAYT